jgi:hypothetical protein
VQACNGIVLPYKTLRVLRREFPDVPVPQKKKKIYIYIGRSFEIIFFTSKEHAEDNC